MLDASYSTSIPGFKPNVSNRESFIAAEPVYQDFNAFLNESPYLQGRKKTKHGNNPEETVTEKTFNKGLDEYLDYFEVKKREKAQLQPPQIPLDSPGDLTIDISPIKGTDDDHDFIAELNRAGLHQPQQTHLPLLGHMGIQGLMKSTPLMTSQSPKAGSAGLDKNTKKVMENMQSKIIKLEQENRKLKKEINDLTNSNKKYQNQVSSFISEQENFAKIRDTYEKRVKKLTDYCKSSEESMSALKRILALQEEELVERFAKKNEAHLLTPSNGAALKHSNSKSIMNKTSRMNTSTNMDASRLGTGELKSNRSGASPFAGLQHKNSVLVLQTPSKMDGRPQTGKAGAPNVSVFDFKGDILTKL